MATAHQLYPTSRTDGMDDRDLRQVQRFAWVDANPLNATPVYDGMDRSDTIATANRTAQDIQAVLNRRAAAAFTRVADIDTAHGMALDDDYVRTHLPHLDTPAARGEDFLRSTFGNGAPQL